MSDDEIRAGIEADPDARPTDESFWKGARVVRPPRAKEPVPVLLDGEIVAWFRQQGELEARINEILRAHVLARLQEIEKS